MKWLEIDVDNMFKWRKRISAWTPIALIAYCGIMMVIFVFSPIGQNMESIDSYIMLLIILGPFFVIAGASLLIEKILGKIEYKAYDFQIKHKLYGILYSELLQYMALNEQVLDCGFPDDEYMEQFRF